jgi:glycosyltransferase involved in cell wall biosynthesis
LSRRAGSNGWENFGIGEGMYSVVIPVYRNEPYIPTLISEFSGVAHAIADRFGLETEFVFVVDGSPDNCHALLGQLLPAAPFRSQLLLHSRNFGSFAAIRTGMAAARGDYFGMISADLQEPPELLAKFLEPLLAGHCDVVIGVRESRADSLSTRVTGTLFWRLYRRLINPEIPEGGVDMFAGTRRIRDELLRLDESHSSLVALVFWVGFRRLEIEYARRSRIHGKSGWTLAKKITYLLDSVFSFTDLPIRLLAVTGVLGLGIALVMGLLTIALRVAGDIQVTGYAATIVTIIFFGALNTLGLGLVGIYAWRAYENTKRRPHALVRLAESFDGAGADGRPVSQ